MCAHLGQQDFGFKVREGRKTRQSSALWLRGEKLWKGLFTAQVYAHETEVWSIIQFKETGKVDSAKFSKENETKSRLKRQFPATPGWSEESPWSSNVAINLWSVLSQENLKACKENAFLNTFYHTIQSGVGGETGFGLAFLTDGCHKFCV